MLKTAVPPEKKIYILLCVFFLILTLVEFKNYFFMLDSPEKGYDTAAYFQEIITAFYSGSSSSAIYPRGTFHTVILKYVLSPLFLIFNSVVLLIALKIFIIFAVNFILLWLVLPSLKPRYFFFLYVLTNPFNFTLPFAEFRYLMLAAPVIIFIVYFILKNNFSKAFYICLTLTLIREEMFFIYLVAGAYLLWKIFIFKGNSAEFKIKLILFILIAGAFFVYKFQNFQIGHQVSLIGNLSYKNLKNLNNLIYLSFLFLPALFLKETLKIFFTAVFIIFSLSFFMAWPKNEFFQLYYVYVFAAALPLVFLNKIFRHKKNKLFTKAVLVVLIITNLYMIFTSAGNKRYFDINSGNFNKFQKAARILKTVPLYEPLFIQEEYFLYTGKNFKARLTDYLSQYYGEEKYYSGYVFLDTDLHLGYYLKEKDFFYIYELKLLKKLIQKNYFSVTEVNSPFILLKKNKVVLINTEKRDKALEMLDKKLKALNYKENKIIIEGAYSGENTVYYTSDGSILLSVYVFLNKAANPEDIKIKVKTEKHIEEREIREKIQKINIILNDENTDYAQVILKDKKNNKILQSEKIPVKHGNHFNLSFKIKDAKIQNIIFNERYANVYLYYPHSNEKKYLFRNVFFPAVSYKDDAFYANFKLKSKNAFIILHDALGNKYARCLNF